MENWDPRRVDFNDQQFNSYVKGPGRNLPTNRPKGDKYVQLFVTGIPNEITQDGLLKLFSRAGNVVSARKMQSKKEGAGDTYGFITMGNAIDAEKAIRELNNYKIDRFSIRVRVSRNEQEQRRSKNYQHDLMLMDDTGFDDDDSDPEIKLTPNGPAVNGFGPGQGTQRSVGRGQILSDLTSATDNTVLKSPLLETPKVNTLPGSHPANLSVAVDQDDKRILSSIEGGVGRGAMMTPAPAPDYNTDHIGRGGNKSRGGGRCYTRGGYGRGYQQSYYDNKQDYYNKPHHRGRGRGGGKGRGRGYMDPYMQGMHYPPPPPFQQPPMMYGMPVIDPYTGSPYPFNMMAAGAPQHLLQPAYPVMPSPMVGPAGAAPQYQAKQVDKTRKMKDESTVTNECSVCYKLGSMRCSRCHEPYCSIDCQTRDWTEHRKVCKTIASEKELEKDFAGQFDVSVGDELIPKVKELIEKAKGSSIEISRKPKPEEPKPKNASTPTKRPVPDASRSVPDASRSGYASDSERSSQKPIANAGRSGYETDVGHDMGRNRDRFGDDRKTRGSGDSRDGGGAKKSPGCLNCGSRDHYRRDCTEPVGINQQCHNCKQKGHLAKDCPTKTENKPRCYNCNKTGHFNKDCPDAGDSVDWFDSETRAAHSLYKTAKNKYNHSKTDENKSEMSRLYSIYRKLARERRPNKPSSQPERTEVSNGHTSSAQTNKPWSSGSAGSQPTQASAQSKKPGVSPPAGSQPSAQSRKPGVSPPAGSQPSAQSRKPAVSPPAGSQPSAQSRKPGVSPPPKKSLATEVLPLHQEVDVVVAEVMSPDNIYVQNINQEKIMQLSQIMTAMGEKFHSSPSDITSAMVGEIYSCRYSADEAWYRVQVLQVDGARVTVQYIDFGNQETTTMDRLRQLEPSMMALPKQAILCSLEGLQPASGTGWSIALSDLQKFITPNAQYKVTARKQLNMPQGNVHELTMKNKDGENVGQSLVSAGLAKVRSSSEPGGYRSTKSPSPTEQACPAAQPGTTVGTGPLMVRDLPRVQGRLTVGQECHVLLTDMKSPASFTVQAVLEDQIKAYTDFNTQFQQVYSTLEDRSYNPVVVGELVAAKFSGDKDWYRGEVLGISNTSTAVVFIDYGNSEDVNNQLVGKALPLCTSVPVQGVKCSLYGIESPANGNWPMEALACFNGYMLEPLMAVVKDVAGGRVGLQLFKTSGESVQDKMKEFGIMFKPEPVTAPASVSAKQPSVPVTKPDAAAAKQHSAPAVKPETAAAELPSVPVSKPEMAAELPSAPAAKLETTPIKPKLAPVMDINVADLPMDGTNVEVIITKVVSLSKIYLQLGGDINIQKQTQLLIDLNTLCATAVPYVPQVGEFVAAQYTEGEATLWYRAKIMEKVDGETYKAFFVDYGNTETVAAVAVARLDASFTSIPCMAVCCKLAKCDTVEDPSALLEIGKLLDMPSLAKAVDYKDDVYSVEVYQKDDGTNINQKILSISGPPSKPAASASVTRPDVVPVSTPSLKPVSVPKSVHIKETVLPLDGSQVTAVNVFIETLSSFCVQIVNEELKDHLGTLATLNQLCEKDSTVYNASLGEYVSARFTTDKSWYRAKVIGKTQQGIEVFFIDFGNTDIVPEDDIRAHCSALDAVPSLAVKCSLAGSGKADDVEKLEDFNSVLNQAVKVKAVEMKGEKYVVEMFLMNDELTCVNTVLNLDMSATPAVAAAPTQATAAAGSSPKQAAPSPRQTAPPAEPQKPETALPVIAIEELPLGQPVAAAPVLINSVNEFYIQSADEQKQRSVMDILVKLQEIYKDSAAAYTPAVGEYVAGLFNDGVDELWYRAVVEKAAAGGQLQLLLIDYGNLITAKPEQIRKLDANFLAHPHMAFKCSLHGFDIDTEVTKKEFSAKSLNREMIIIAKKIESGTYAVELKQLDGQNMVEHLLSVIRTASATSEIVDHLPKPDTPKKEPLPRKSASPSSGERKVVFAQTLTYAHPETDNVNVVITSVAKPNHFHCQVFQEDQANLKDLKLLTDTMKLDCEHSLSVDDPKFEVGELCCAKFPEDGEWYRATVLEVFPDKTANVLYVDYGNQCEVTVSNLRPVRLEYTVLPRLAFKCTLHGVSPATGSAWSQEASAKLREFENRPLRAKVVEAKADMYVMELEDILSGENVASQLIKAGVATPPTATPPAAAGSREAEMELLQRQNQLLEQKVADMQAMMAKVLKQ